MEAYSFRPLGFIRTPFPEKFGIPRQPRLAETARGVLTLEKEFRQVGILDSLEGTSHVWLVFVFHGQPDDWQPKVRPPRLGGNEKRGVFSTRSPRRPNRIGLSAVELEKVDRQDFRLTFRGVDLLDGTPILDIKPYIAYSDSIPQAIHPFAGSMPPLLPVIFSGELETDLSAELTELIRQTLSLDPRPKFHQDERIYGTSLDGRNVKWRVLNGEVVVLEVQSCDSF